jgi:sugar lactone lactonase YvrE
VSAEFTLILDAQCTLGESPVWCAEPGLLVFVDISGRRLHRFDPLTRRHDVDSVEEDIGCVAPAKGGGYLAGLRSGLWLLDAQGTKLRQLAPNPQNPATNRFNDGRVAPRGRYFTGTLDETKAAGNAALFRYDKNGIAQVMDGVMTSNGLAFSPDGRTLYFSDTPRFVIYRFDYDPATGEAANRRIFARIEPTATDRGRPDGAAVDEDGCYWSSLYEGSRVRRFDPDGKMMADYPVPALNPTMPAFGGADRKTLFVTTAHDKKGGPGGGLYAMSVDVAGVQGSWFDPQAG